MNAGAGTSAPVAGWLVRACPSPAWLVLLSAAGVEAGWADAAALTIGGARLMAAVALGPCLIGVLCRAAGRWPVAGEIADTVGLWMAFSALMLVLTYLSARAALPLQDATFADIDHAIGFDRRTWIAAVDSVPAVARVLDWAYASLAWQLLFACVSLPIIGGRRAADLFWAACVSILITCVLAAAFPSNGGPLLEGMASQHAWRAHLAQVRSAPAPVYWIPGMQGIVQFPSFHAVLGVLLIYAHRRTGALGAAVAVLNVLMIASTVTGGGHYLVDVIAGIVVALVAIVMVRAVSAALGTAPERPGSPAPPRLTAGLPAVPDSR